MLRRLLRFLKEYVIFDGFLFVKRFCKNVNITRQYLKFFISSFYISGLNWVNIKSFILCILKFLKKKFAKVILLLESFYKTLKYPIINWRVTLMIIVCIIIIIYSQVYTKILCNYICFLINMFKVITILFLHMIKVILYIIIKAFYFGLKIFIKEYIYNCFSTNFSIIYYLSFFFNIFVSFAYINRLGYRGVFFYNLFFLTFVFIHFMLNFYGILFENKIYKYNFGYWIITHSNYKTNFSLLIDQISFSFAFLTIVIAFFVYIYAYAYFKYEPLVDRFMIFLCLFLASMVLFVLSNNLIVMFLGWELIGITSFLLINFWSTKISTLKSAFKAFTFNKISDMFMFIFILLLNNIFSTLDITVINSQIYILSNIVIYIFNIKTNVIEVLGLLLLIPASIKSAQFGAHIWLPDSMEAPVPASALIHSATLVSAGVFLLLRFNVFFDYTYICNILIPLLGSLTAFTGSILACFQTDIKKILAYSTISHCGFLFYLSTTSLIEYTIFYLFTHGFFKAASFMCIGNVLRITRGYQDFRRMGGLWKYLPFEYHFTFICLFNLAGLPFSLGFASKHLIIYSVDYNAIFFYLNYYFINIASILGLLYSFRLFIFVFLDFKKGRKSIYKPTIKINYFSKYYSNSSWGSILPIFFLVMVSYIILLVFYFHLYKISSATIDISTNINNVNHNNLIKPDKIKQINIMFINFFLFFIFFFFFYWLEKKLLL